MYIVILTTNKIINMEILSNQFKPTKNENMYLFKYLPEDVIINHIMPYAYRVQPKILLWDIRSFYIDYSLIINTYYTMYNDNILLYDLRKFMEGNLRNRNFVTRNNDISREYCKQINNTIKHKKNSKCIWANLTPNERTQFINQNILELEIDE